ncbi:UDP-glucosyltransferase 29-like [Lycium barbarum]|uniref:UDP-glucosyltransferase 29-like n=1 Tax=Lycium barbarum TaxID=112863 RepID=UPI00293E6B7D|nr:UDP-glucosyltransferase 29-like [Lycium barbarum]
MEESQRNTLKVLMVPWLAHGHATSFFELAKRLSKCNFYVYFCSTPIILNFLKQSQSNYYFSNYNHSNTNIELIELHLPSTLELPLENQTTKGLPRHLFPILLKCYKNAGPIFSNIVTNVNPDLIIYDIFQNWAPKIASTLHIPAVSYIILGAATTSFFYNLYAFDGSRDFPFPELFLPRYRLEKLCSENASMTKFFDDIFALSGLAMSQDIILINNWKCTETKYMEYFSDLTKNKVISVGPLIGNTESKPEDSEDIIIKWLDKKEPYSTLYAAFGSECVVNKEEIEEIARGLELSNVNFIWVVNFPSGGKISSGIDEILPEGFKERVKERGMIVTKWAPQAKILRHFGIGGFLNHCGSNFILESLHFGVPLIAMPVLVDQFIAARYMVELGVGLEVERNENGKVKAEEMVKVIKNVIVEKKGNELRGKSRELSEKMKREEGKEIDEAVVELQKLCLKNKNLS